MQLLSVKNGGIIEYEGIEPTLADELALTLDEDVENVKITLSFLDGHGLISEGENGTFLLPEAAAKIGSESDSKERVRAYRERKRLEMSSENVTCNALVTESNTDIDIDIENRDRERDRKNSAGAKRRAPHFSPPSLQEVQEYCKERGNNIDAESFIDFYESKGWMVGSSKMKNWKAAVRTWENREKKVKGNGKELGETGTDYSVPDDWA